MMSNGFQEISTDPCETNFNFLSVMSQENKWYLCKFCKCITTTMADINQKINCNNCFCVQRNYSIFQIHDPTFGNSINYTPVNQLDFVMPDSNKSSSLVDVGGISVARTNLDMNVKLQLQRNPTIYYIQCNKCEFKFESRYELWAHKRSHMGNDKYAKFCQQCPFVTKVNEHFEHHKNWHLGVKPFKCSQCSYASFGRRNLIQHMQSHK